MLHQLISLTNREDFWGNWHLRLEEAQFSESTLNFTVLTKHDNYSEPDQEFQLWEVRCEGVTEEKLIDRLQVPNFVINIFDDHPLPWGYERSVVLKISGQVRSLAELLGRLFQTHVKATGDWLDFKMIAGGLYWNLEKKGRADMLLPERLLNEYLMILQQHGNVQIEAGWEGIEGLRVLFIGNKNISQDNYRFGQAYVIARRFSAHLVAPNIVLQKVAR